MQLTIRPYAPEDFPALECIHDAARRTELHLAELDGAFVPLCEAAEREGLFDYRVVVAQEGEEIVGFAAFSPDELAWLYVDPARQRRGVGRSLVRHAVSQCAGQPMSVEVLCGNEPARRLYASEGFCEREILSGRMPGNEAFEVRVHVMTRE